MDRISRLAAIAAAMVSAPALAGVIWTTGDLGNNVILDSGDFLVFPMLEDPDPAGPHSMTVKYGLWNSPNVTVSVFVNDVHVGNFIADQGYIIPGPEYITYDVTGLLLDGSNTVLFTGFGANAGDYVVGQVDVLDEPVPAPAGALVVLGAGILGMRRRRA
jgi:hypothetical protein